MIMTATLSTESDVVHVTFEQGELKTSTEMSKEEFINYVKGDK